MAISQIPALTAFISWQLHISFLIWELDIWQTKCWQIYSHFLEWQFHWFLLWHFLFHSYSKSLSFGTPGPDRSTSPCKQWFHRFQLYSDSSYLADPLVKWQFHRFLWNSYFIPSLTALHLADQVLADLPPSSKAISQIPALIWELIFGRPCIGRSTPCQMAILQISASDSSYFIPTLRAHHLADQVLTDLPPIQWWFYRFLLWQLTTLRTSHLADQVLADLPIPSNGNFTDSCETHDFSYLLWELNIWQTRSWQIWPPTSNGTFTDSCEIHISFLLWELNIWLTRSWQIYCPPSNGNFTDSYSTLKAHICQSKCFLINPPPTNGNFTDVGRSTSPSNSNFTDSCSTLRAHI